MKTKLMRNFLIIALFFCLNYFASPRLESQDLLGDFKPREIGPTVFGGRVVDIEVDQHASHRIFVASASGGLWLTENNGTTWSNIFQNEATISIGDIAIDPIDSKVVWIGTGEANNQRSSLWGNGIYKSSDRGKSWTHLGLDDTHHIGRVLIDPDNTDTVYVAALGHLYSQNEERGLFKTKDGGKSWEKILYVNDKVGVVDLVMDPTDSKTLFAATYERDRRAWNFNGAGPGSAIYKTTDGGKTWKKLTKGLPHGNIGRIGLAIYPKNPKVLYATVSNQNPAPQRTSSRTPSRTGKSSSSKSKQDPKEESPSDVIDTPFGFKIRHSDQGFFITGLSSNHPARRNGLNNRSKVESLGGVVFNDPQKLQQFVATLKGSDRIALVATTGDKKIELDITAPVAAQRPPRQIGGEVYRTDDGGETWKKVNRQPVGGTPAYYYGQIRIDPQDDKRLYILSIPLYSSTDGGKNWTSVARSVHVDHHALWINPNAPNHIMLGNDGGFHQSYDYGRTMVHHFNIPMSQFYALTVDMQEPYHVYGGTQDNGSWGGPSRSGGFGRSRSGVNPFQWYRIGGGDGFYVQVDPNDHNFFIAESQFGAIFKGNRQTGFRKSIRPRPTVAGESYRFNWNSPILMSQHDSRTIYFGGNKLFKSYNQGDNWEEISGDLTTANVEKLKGNVPHCTITSIAESPKDRNVLLVGTDDGKVQMTRDGGKSWADLSDNFPVRPKEWWCSRVELSHHDANTAYASFTGYREDDFRCFIFKTNDMGETWKSINGNLPQESVNVIKEDRVNPNLLYVGTELGCYISLDGGEKWDPVNGLPRVSVQDLLIHPRDNDLVLGTHGRGFFIVDDITPLQQLHRKSDTSIQLLTPRKVKSYRSQPAPSISGDTQFIGRNPAESGRIWYRVKSKSDDEFTIRVTDKTGKEVHQSTAKKTPGLKYIRVVIGRSRPSSGRSRFGGRSSQAQATNSSVIMVTAGTYEVSMENNRTKEKQTAELIVE